MSILSNSKRSYNIYVVDSKGNYEFFSDVQLKTILSVKENHEVIFSLQEIVDDVLDIPENATLSFKLRDDKFSHGLITRIQ